MCAAWSPTSVTCRMNWQESRDERPSWIYSESLWKGTFNACRWLCKRRIAPSETSKRDWRTCKDPALNSKIAVQHSRVPSTNLRNASRRRQSPKRNFAEKSPVFIGTTPTKGTRSPWVRTSSSSCRRISPTAKTSAVSCRNAWTRLNTASTSCAEITNHLKTKRSGCRNI
uniref:(northern house mosquito) hypothetical protein n=1 Tax=Culex pipiens TaxID=7175 RepID=A0A8D8I6W2_CULPI